MYVALLVNVQSGLHIAESISSESIKSVSTPSEMNSRFTATQPSVIARSEDSDIAVSKTRGMHVSSEVKP
jgi:hypothetical protein